MNPKQLQWKIQTAHPKVWISRIKEYGWVQIEIYSLLMDNYLLRSNLIAVKDLIAEDIDFTKQLAHHLLETHIHSLIETNTDEA